MARPYSDLANAALFQNSKQKQRLMFGEPTPVTSNMAVPPSMFGGSPQTGAPPSLSLEEDRQQIYKNVGRVAPPRAPLSINPDTAPPGMNNAPEPQGVASTGTGFNPIVGTRIGNARALSASEQLYGRHGETEEQHKIRVADIGEARRRGVTYQQLLDIRKSSAERAAQREQAMAFEQQKLNMPLKVEETRANAMLTRDQGKFQHETSLAQMGHDADAMQQARGISGQKDIQAGKDAAASERTKMQIQGDERVATIGAKGRTDAAAIEAGAKPPKTPDGAKPRFGGLGQDQQAQERRRWQLKAIERAKAESLDWESLPPQEKARLANEEAIREGRYILE